MFKKACVAILMCGVFGISSIGSVVEASYMFDVENTNVISYGLFDDIKNEIKNDIKNKVKEKKKEIKDGVKERVKDGVKEKIGDLVTSK